MNEAKKGFWESVAWAISDKVKSPAKEPEIEADEFLSQALNCLDESQTRHSRQSLGAELAHRLKGAPSHLQGDFIAALAIGLGAEKNSLKEAVSSLDWADVDMARIESKVLGALGSRRRKLLRLWMTMDGALEFLVWLREKTMERALADHAAQPLKEDLDALMGDVFAQGLLQMRQITWRSPALVLEKIMRYEQVHKMSSWGDLKARLGKDRRVFAVFHSGWPDEPLAFLEVALTKGVAKSVKNILEQEVEIDVGKADTATFYSINAPHAGLKGISFGEDLIRKSVEELRREMPHVKTFCTLSPIPGFGRWLDALGQDKLEALCGSELIEKLAKKVGAESAGNFLNEMKKQNWTAGPMGAASRDMLEKLCAKYLAGQEVDDNKRDPVARFHLGNGARVEALCHLADPSEKGIAQSRAMMVNYLYDLPSLEKNKLSLGEGAMAASRGVRRLAKN